MNQSNYRLTLAQGFLAEAQQDAMLIGRTPWELFDEDDAHQAVTMAVEAAALAQAIVEELKSSD